MKKLRLVVYVIIIMFVSVYTEAKAFLPPDYLCNTNGVIRYAGVEGGCWYIQLDNGELIEPIDLTNMILKDGQKVKLSYKLVADSVFSACMVSRPAFITCITPVIDSIECTVDFNYFAIKCSPEMSSVKCGSNSYQFMIEASIDSLIDWYWTINGIDTIYTFNPVISFPEVGKYEVCLTVVDINQCVAQKCKIIEVGDNLCKADFIYEPLDYIKPPIDSIVYPFEEVLKNSGSVSSSMEILPPIYDPFTYSFIDKSYGEVARWEWNIEGNFYSQQNVIHTFADSGYHEVCLTIYTTDSCISTVCKKVYVEFLPECKSHFTFYKSHTYPVITDTGDSVYVEEYPTGIIDTIPLPNEKTVYFFDQSFGKVINWMWDFGDGTVSYVQNPIHTYKEYGVYNVCLKIETLFGCSDVYCATVIIKSPTLCKSDFEYCNYDNYYDSTISHLPYYIVGFKDRSVGCITDYYWEFGDGFTSYEQNPVHKYQMPGIYSVCLQAYGRCGCFDRTCKRVMVGVDCEIDFNWNANFPNCIGFKPVYDFYITNTDDSISFVQWDFGDGTFSNELNPLHMFDTYGEYQVCLTANKLNGCKTRICKYVNQYMNDLDSLHLKNCGTTLIDKINEGKGLNVEKIYPNPAFDQLNISLSSDSYKKITISFVNMMGIETKTINYELEQGNNEIAVDISNLNNGYYIYKINSSDEIIRGTVMKK